MVNELVHASTCVDDVEFVKIFKDPIATYYLDAARYQKTLPEFALMRMRQVVEGLCREMATHFGLVVPVTINLYQLITDLRDSGKFKKAIADDLHLIRMHANSFVHAEKLAENHAGRAVSSQNLVEILQVCRDALCRVIVAFGCSIKTVQGIFSLQQRQFDTLTQEELITKAVLSMEPKDKYLAGLAVGMMAQEYLAKKVGLVFTEQQKFQYRSMQRLASTFYLAAIELDAELDQVPISYRDAQNKNLAFTRSNAEYLFQFADVVVHGDIGDELREKGLAALEIAALNKGHVTAKALLAGVYYENANYELVLKLASDAYESGELRALKVLFYFYAEGKACPVDIAKAQSYLESGVEKEYLPAFILLGKELWSGKLLEQNKSLGLHYMRQAEDKGELEATKLIPILDGTAERQFKEIGEQMISEFEKFFDSSNAKPHRAEVKLPSEQQIKVGRNEPCICGSGKKSKKCCNR